MMPRQEYYPVAAQVLLEWANVSQLVRMWREHTAAGQSLVGWLSVFAALLLFLAFYRHKRLTTVVYTTAFGLLMNTLVILTVLYFRRSA
jgi:uncharacterized protein with PQ loop repeat